MSYDVGNLTLSIATINKDAIAPINQTISALKRLSKAITTISSVSSSATINQKNLTKFFTSLSSATAKLNLKGLSELSNIGKAISGISSITKLEKANWDKISNGFNRLTTAITPFVTKVKEASTGLVALDGIMNKIGFRKMAGGGKKDGQGFLGQFASALPTIRLMSVYFIARRIGAAIGKIAQAGGDYVETLNLWETSMDKNLDKAQKFVDTMNKAYGISDQTLMQAQATFKNMLGALGNISDEVAYTLSEGVTQMAVDYASLYNQSFDKAFSKFQAALAGQVRPIRSVSGFDITENTIYQLYTSLGGTKTMRQLNRTEKQLLSLLAIYNQMEATSAKGDLAKTMNSYANQARVAKEMWQQILAYSGTLLTNWLYTSGVMKTVVGYLIYFAEVLKSAAESTGAIQHFANDPFAGTEESAESASDAVDELNGKLLDFDKFRSLSGKEDSYITIDDKLVNALSTFSSYISQVKSDAHEFAKELKDASGLFNEDGTFNKERWDELGKSIKNVAIVIGVSLVGLALAKLIASFFTLNSLIGAITMAVVLFVAAWNDMTPLTKATSVILILVAAVTALYAVTHGMAGVAKLIGMVAATTLAIASITSMVNNAGKQGIDAYKNGGLPDKGTMFLAGEAGAEIVYNNPNGQSGVVNVAQIKQAMYQALVEYGRTSGGNDRPIEVYLDGEKVYESTTAHASRHGNKWVKA